MSSARVETRPALRVAAVRHVGAYQTISKAFERLGALAGPAGLFSGPGATMIGIYYDDPDATPAGALRSDAGITVQPETPVPAGLSEQRLPAGRYACAEYRGPYGGLSNAWAELKSWARANDLRAAGGSYELYFNDPMNTAPADLKTGLYLQLV